MHCCNIFALCDTNQYSHFSKWYSCPSGITEMAGWHHGLDGHESVWTLGDGDGQGGLAAAVYGVAKSQTRLNDWTELNWTAAILSAAAKSLQSCPTVRPHRRQPTRLPSQMSDLNYGLKISLPIPVSFLFTFSQGISWLILLHFQLCIPFSSVQSLSRVRLFVTPWITACQASLFITISRSSLRLTSIESVMPSSHLILGRPLLLLPPIPPSIRFFSNESTLHIGCNKSSI